MSIEVKVPVLPESVADATIACWHKSAGDSVQRDENLVDLETDKVVLEVPAPCDGILKSINKQVGDQVTNYELLAIIEAGVVAKPTEDSETPTSTAETAANDAAVDVASQLSPSVRRLVAENELDPNAIVGTGRDGRIIKADVLKYMAASQAAALAATNQTTKTEALPSGLRVEERVPMSRLRARIAERMVAVQSTAAMLTSFNEVDLDAVMGLRKKYQEAFEKQHATRLGLMSFFVKACGEALRKYPVVNASVDGSDVIYHGYQDIGIAVSTERGLVVPILRDAAAMSMAEIEIAIRGYAAKARSGHITMDDLQGGTFTITNGGVFGSLLSTPILNPPQSAILGMHAIKQRPVVVDGNIVARPMMYIALTYDHRIVDGRDAVLFLVAVKDLLEDPARMLLNI